MMDEPSRRYTTFQENETFIQNVDKIIEKKNTKLLEVYENDGFQRSCFDSSQSKKCK